MTDHVIGFLDAIRDVVEVVLSYPEWFEEMANRMTCYKNISEATEIDLDYCDHCDLLAASEKLVLLINKVLGEALQWRQEDLDKERHET